MGFNCVEADIYLVDGKLYVAHDLPEDISNLKTLDELYFTPLFERIKKNGGRVYPESTEPFYLMVDIKRQGEEVYRSLMVFLEQHKEMFCSYQDGVFKSGPILLFFSGNRPIEELSSQLTRYAFLDGNFAELGQNIPESLMPIVSDNYKTFFHWNGEGTMPEEEVIQLKKLVQEAHLENKKIRFWGAPNSEAWIRTQVEHGVDLIATDNLKELSNLLNSLR